jgi:DNA-directed RNA polymerase specialized sigma24 family protein
MDDDGRIDDRSIDAAGFARLLERLDPDPQRAAAEYERLRRTLLKFFDWRGALSPADCVDATLDRLARKLADTVVGDVHNYARGIARMVLLEQARHPEFSTLDNPQAAAVPTIVPDPVAYDTERRHDCFDRCLAKLPVDSRTLVTSYYQDQGGGKIATRRRLADARGLSENALRSRVQRLRDRLERCIRECMAGRKDDG